MYVACEHGADEPRLGILRLRLRADSRDLPADDSIGPALDREMLDLVGGREIGGDSARIRRNRDALQARIREVSRDAGIAVVQTSAPSKYSVLISWGCI